MLPTLAVVQALSQRNNVNTGAVKITGAAINTDL